MARKAEKRFSFPVVNADFVKSSYSNPGGIISTCVEIARKPHGAAIRDSKDPDGPVLFFRRDEFRAFLKGVKAGEFGA